MKIYTITFSKQAIKDIRLLSPKMKEKLKEVLINVISMQPYCGKKLVGDFKGAFSYRLSIKDRIVYDINEKNKDIFIIRAKTHYGD